MIEKSKILLVDNRRENLIAVSKLLNGFEAEMVLALSGKEALTATLKDDFALAIVHMQMPDMDGYETVKQMRQVEKTRYIPVIFVSSMYSENHYAIQGIEAGTVDFITKPIIPGILLGKVKIFLDLHKQQQMLTAEIKNRIKSEKALNEAEKKLLEAKIKADEADKLKSAFLANMSHEIRTPMNAIIGFSNLLNNPSLSPQEREEYIGYINNSGKSLLNIIDDIIDIAKIEAGHIKIIQGPSDVKALMVELQTLFNEQLANNEKSMVKLYLSVPENKSLLITSDELRLRQVVSNLISNALKFTEKGSVNFGCTVSDNNKDIIFYVKDSGIGIPKDKLELVFNRFEQIKDERIQNKSGTGIGLSITKKMVELMGGEIWVNSQLDVGTEFYFKIPYKPIKQTTLDKVAEAFQDQKNDYSHKNILIAEDEYINYMFLREALNQTEANIFWARNGKEAVEMCDKKNIDLVLMDIKMPIMTGYDATLEIKRNHKKIPIIAQTAYAMAGEKEMCLKAGFDDYLTKPIPPDELLNVISRFI